MGRHHQAGWCRTPTRVRAEACESTTTNSEGLSRAVSPEDVVALQRLVAGAAQVGDLRQQARDVGQSQNQSSAQRWAAVVDAEAGAEPLKPVSRSPTPLSPLPSWAR